MNFGDALQLLKQGDSVRLKKWSKDTHIFLDNDKLFMNYKTDIYPIHKLNMDFVLSVDWELYREYS